MLTMTHEQALAAQNGLLADIHCALQEDPSEAGRLLYRARRSVAQGQAWTAEELAWLAQLDSDYHTQLGMWRP